MKFLRFLLPCLTTLALLVAILVGAAFIPTVQTWVAQWAIDQQSTVQGSFDSVSATPNAVEVENLHLTNQGITLTAPLVQVGAPLFALARDRKVAIRSLVAKGWTLDLRPSTALARGRPGQPINPAELAAGSIIGALKGWALPCDVSVDHADIEGDILFVGASAGIPLKIHVAFKGGGLSAGHDGTFAADASSVVLNSDLSPTSYSGHGQVIVSMNSPRTLNRVEVKGDVAAQGGLFPAKRTFAVDVSASRGDGTIVYSVDLNSGDRHMASFAVTDPGAGKRLTGSWKINLKDSDAAPYFPDHPLPTGELTGSGRFDADRSANQTHLTGSLTATGTHWGALFPQLEPMGALKVVCGIDAIAGKSSVHFDRLSAAIAGEKPIAAAEALQPFDYDWKTGLLGMSDPAKDWTSVSLRGVPLAWLRGLTGSLALEGNDVAGEFVVRGNNGGFSAEAKSPLVVSGVTLSHDSKVVGRNLDISLSPTFDYAPGGWHLLAHAVTVSSAGRAMATADVSASQSGGDDQPVALTGKWTVDLEALAAAQAIPLVGIAGQSAAGDFSASLGYPTVMQGKVSVIGHDAMHTVETFIHLRDEGDGRFTFSAPTKIAWGKSASDLSIEGSTARDETGSRLVLQVTGNDASLENIAPIAAFAAGMSGAPLAVQTSGRDKIPFWGNWTGNITATFENFHAKGQDYKDVGGSIVVDHGSLHLERGRFTVTVNGKPILPTFSANLTFDPAAEYPYSLTGTGSLDKIEVGPFFGPKKPDAPPPVEGPFTISGSIAGKGVNALDLTQRTKEVLTFSSTAAIVQILGTQVDQQITVDEKTSPSDVAKAVGSKIGGFFGLDKGEHTLAANHLSKNMEAVLNFNNQIAEIGCDKLSFAVTRDFDGTIHVADFSLLSQDIRLAGSGMITAQEGLPVLDRPLSLDLTLSAHGDLAGLLKDARLASDPKDKDGFLTISQPVHLGGTLAHIDRSQWSEVLSKAATWKPPVAK